MGKGGGGLGTGQSQGQPGTLEDRAEMTWEEIYILSLGRKKK